VKVLGIDPGPTTSGWALLAWDVSGRPAYVASGELTSRGGDARALLEKWEPEAVAVEKCSGVFRGAAAIPLLDTNWVGGMFTGLAIAHGWGVEEIKSAEWRLALTGKRGATDGEVERVLRGHVEGMPAPRQTNAHERDALGVACSALWRLRLRRSASDSGVSGRVAPNVAA
jgi:Holliday junction resolvasome RuvABC endonuclease subunit